MKARGIKAKLVAIMFVFALTVQVYAISDYSGEGRQIGSKDPYALMYDSNEKLLDIVDDLPETSGDEWAADNKRDSGGSEKAASSTTDSPKTVRKRSKSSLRTENLTAIRWTNLIYR